MMVQCFVQDSQTVHWYLRTIYNWKQKYQYGLLYDTTLYYLEVVPMPVGMWNVKQEPKNVVVFLISSYIRWRGFKVSPFTCNKTGLSSFISDNKLRQVLRAGLESDDHGLSQVPVWDLHSSLFVSDWSNTILKISYTSIVSNRIRWRVYKKYGMGTNVLCG